MPTGFQSKTQLKILLHHQALNIVSSIFGDTMVSYMMKNSNAATPASSRKLVS